MDCPKCGVKVGHKLEEGEVCPLCVTGYEPVAPKRPTKSAKKSG